MATSRIDWTPGVAYVGATAHAGVLWTGTEVAA